MPVRSSLFPLLPNALRGSARIAMALVALAFVGACSTDQPDMTGLHARAAEARSGVPFTEALASAVWQDSARQFVAHASLAAVAATHIYPVLGVSQYLAVQRAEAAIGGSFDDNSSSSANSVGEGGRLRMETDRGAVAGASVVALTYLFPARAAMLQTMEATQKNGAPGKSAEMLRAFEAGEAIGRAVAATIVTRTIGDGFTNANTAVPPVGPGFWVSSAIPAQIVAGGQLPGVTPWFMTSASQFPTAPPPDFGSPAFVSALTEIRQISDTRTAEQDSIATYWALSNGTPTTAGFWVERASDWIAEGGLSERDATHLYALLSATMFDAQIACWNEKLTAWLIRPWRADPLIHVVAAVGKPNHPSYPSGHSCLSASAAEVLSTFFPEKRAQLDAMVIQAGLSRMYGGIHYRFDIVAGQTLGRQVAAYTIGRDASGESVLTPH